MLNVFKNVDLSRGETSSLKRVDFYFKGSYFEICLEGIGNEIPLG